MKKVLLLAVLGLGVMTTSCKKDWTCECTTTTGGQSLFGDPIPPTTQSTSVPINDQTKGDAEDACDGLNSSSNIFGTTIETACALQ